MSTNLPPDRTLIEKTLRTKIKEVLDGVSLISTYSHVYTRERSPDSDEEDRILTTIQDPVVATNRITSVIQIGEATIQEAEYTDDRSTQLDFTYPISFDFQFIDQWDNPNSTLEFDNSTDLVSAIFMRAGMAFKFNTDGSSNRTLGYNNCVHFYLQREGVGLVEDEETKLRLHVQDWSIKIACTGVLV